ncbi:hypothetical protein KW803_02490 [Candidatus Saccharibacteria bacterium]|nr:hypothetical protein [Candidatus Saccharibacteria bacterium]
MSQEQTPGVVDSKTSSAEGIQPGLADRTEAMSGIAQARENLGQVATGHEVHADMSGNLLTPKEIASVARGEANSK